MRDGFIRTQSEGWFHKDRLRDGFIRTESEGWFHKDTK